MVSVWKERIKNNAACGLGRRQKIGAVSSHIVRRRNTDTGGTGKSLRLRPVRLGG